MKINYQILLSIIILCTNQQLHAETMISDDNEESILVTASTVKTGTVLAQKISEMPAVSQVINEDEIQLQGTGNRTVGDILAQLIPSLGTSSGSTSNYGTTMHGRPVQYLLNGVPLSSARSLSRELNSIDSKQLERVEVISGATSIYGAGASGGLINLVTKSQYNYGRFMETRIGTSSSKNFDSDSLGYHVGQTAGYGGEKWYGRIDVDYDAKGGNFDSNGDRISPDVNQTDQQDTNSLSLNGTIGINLTDSQTIDLAVTHYNDQQHTNYGPDYGENLAVLYGVTPSLEAIDGASIENEPQTTKTSINLNYNNDDVVGSNLSVTGYFRNEKDRFYPSVKSITEQSDYVAYSTGNPYFITQSEAEVEVIGVRAVMQTEAKFVGKNILLSYGSDFEREKSEQIYYGQDFNEFFTSNGLSSQTNGLTYNGGPVTTTDKLGIFINADIDLTEKWHTSAGIRYQKIRAETDAFIPIYEQMFEEYYANDSATNYEAGMVEEGSTNHNKTLFNIGTSYQITPNNQVFVNFSQGFTTADIQRALRDVRAGFVVNSNNVQPITTNSYEFGWQGRHGNTAARLSSFYNESDKIVRFTDSYTVEVVDTNERVYGLEGSLSYLINDRWQVGGTAAYTRGQYKNNGDWLELSAVRLTPLKGTVFTQYAFNGGSSIRLQALAVAGDDRAFKDQQKDPESSALPVTGYMTVDLLGEVKMPVGQVSYGIYNLFNKDYLTVYHQTTYGEMNRLPASGTTLGLSYAFNY